MSLNILNICNISTLNGESGGKMARILIIEDDERVRTLLAKFMVLGIWKLLMYRFFVGANCVRPVGITDNNEFYSRSEQGVCHTPLRFINGTLVNSISLSTLYAVLAIATDYSAIFCQ